MQQSPRIPVDEPIYPEGRSVFRWLKEGWYIPIAYVVGFLAMLLLLGWNPDVSAGAVSAAH